MLPKETPEICRLCLVKEHVDINIFEDNSADQLFYKISSCLPISITTDDELPKKICSNCCDKVNLLYEFWNQTLHAQKYLLTWLNDENKCASQIGNADSKSAPLSEKEAQNFQNFENCKSNGQKVESYSNNGSPDFWCNTQEENDDYDGNLSFNDDDCGASDGESNQIQTCVPEDSAPSALKRLQGYAEELSNSSLSNLSRIFHVLNSPGELTSETNLTCETSFRECEEPLPSFRCDECCKNFSCKDILAMHKISQCFQKMDPFQCNTCHETFWDNFTLGKHAKICSKKKTNSEMSEASPSSNLPSSTHKDINPFICIKCDSVFRYKKTYETHIKIHENEKITIDEQLFVCDVCEQRFSTRNSYIHHARRHKSISNEAKLTCTTCNRIFSTKRLLIDHQRMHCEVKKFSCDSCGEELLTKESLDSHKLAHKNDKTLICHVCNKTFSHRKYFIVHQRIHTGERPYKCVTCGKTFTQASALTVHRRYHTGERPYKCHICSKGFVTRTIMLTHLKYHKSS